MILRDERCLTFDPATIKSALLPLLRIGIGICGRCGCSCRGVVDRSIAFSLLLPGTPAIFIPDGLLPVNVALGAYGVKGYPRLSGDDPAWRRLRSVDDDEEFLSAGTVLPAVRRKSSHVTSSASLGCCEGGGGGLRDEELLIPIRCCVVSRDASISSLYKDC